MTDNIDSLIIQPVKGSFLLYSGLTPSLVKDRRFDTNRRVTTGVYTDQYDWDTHFISKTLLGINPQEYSSVVKGSLLNFLALQSPDGFIPRTVGYDGIKDFPGHHKPFLFQTLLLLHQNGDSLDWLKDDFLGFQWKHTYSHTHSKKDDPALWSAEKYAHNLTKTHFKPIERLEKYLKFYDQFRRVPGTDLYSWENIVESGIDTTLALRPRVYAPIGDVTEETVIQGSPVPKIAAVDLQVYMFNEFKAAAQVFALLGNYEKESYYLSKASFIKQNFLQTFWDEADGFFYNRYFKAPKQSELIDIPAWMGFLPLSAEGLIDNKVIIESVIERHILSEDAFMTPYGLRSLSRRSPVGGGDSPRALVPEYWFEAANWNGPIWILTNLYGIQILEMHGRQTEANELLSKVNRLLARDIKENNMMHEQYSYIDGKPGWAEDFMSWNTCVFLLNHQRQFGLPRPAEIK